MRQIVALLLGLTVVAQSAPGWPQAASRPQTASAQPASRDGTGQQVTYGAGSVLGTLVYSPVKASFCILGAVSSGFAFPIAGSKTAGNIVSSTCGGTWAITPDALKGKERVRFIGNTSF